MVTRCMHEAVQVCPQCCQSKDEAHVMGYYLDSL